MTRRKTIAVLSFLPLLAVAAWLLSPTRPCRHGFEGVRQGMTMAEVVAVVGGPAGDYRSSDNYLSLDGRSGSTSNTDAMWFGNDASMWIGFDETGRVVKIDILPMFDFNPGWFQRIRIRIGL